MNRVQRRMIRPKPWSKLTQKDAEAIDAWLSALAARLGLNPYEANAIDAIYDAAMEDKGCPLRKYMTWDINTAIKNWHKHQIRNLIGSYEVVVIFEDGTEETHRALKNVIIENVGCDEIPREQRVYMPTRSFSEHPELLDQVILDHLERLRYWRHEARVLRIEGIFAEIVGKIDEFSETFEHQIEKKYQEIQEAVSKADASLTGRKVKFRASVLLILASFVGTDTKRLVAYTGYPIDFVSRVRKRLIRARIWADKRPCKDHAWKTKHLVLDGFWEDVKVALK